MSDLISRQKAKDAIDMALDHIDHVPPWVYDNLLNALNEVPSAEKVQLSEEDATKDTTSGLIRRQDAIDALGKEPKFKIKMIKTYAEGRSDQWFKDVASIASLPSVESTIIRCRDCKHHDGIRCFRWNSTIITGFDDFCSNAEKRGEEDE